MSSMDNPDNLSQKSYAQKQEPQVEPSDNAASSIAHQTRIANQQQAIRHHNQPISHPNFDPHKVPLNPDRPLSDIPSPVRRERSKLDRIYTLPDDQNPSANSSYKNPKSARDLLVSPSFASHLDLLQVAGLINLPDSFFKPPNNSSDYPLLPPLADLTLLDMADVYGIWQQVADEGLYLTRYGLKDRLEPKLSSDKMPEMINDGYAPDWELILYPEHFDNGVDSITTDILACSVAVFVLSQCQTRKTINNRLSAQQICHHMRSYVLSQCHLYPHKSARYRQVRLFEGHVIVAAKYLGLKISTNQNANAADTSEVNVNKVNASKISKSKVSSNKINENDRHNDDLDSTDIDNDLGNTDIDDTDILNKRKPNKLEVYFNLSSRSSLFVRYPNISSFYINGWK